MMTTGSLRLTTPSGSQHWHRHVRGTGREMTGVPGREQGARDATRCSTTQICFFFLLLFFSVLNDFLSIVMTRQQLSITNTNSDTNTRPPCHNDDDKQPVRPELLTSTLGTTTITTTCSTTMRQHADTIFRDDVRQMEAQDVSDTSRALVSFFFLHFL